MDGEQVQWPPEEKEIPGWQKLLDDCAAVEAIFAQPEFGGVFEMRDWGKHVGSAHKAEENHFCGTQACLAGWLGLLGKHEFKAVWGAPDTGGEATMIPNFCFSFKSMAAEVYGMSRYDAGQLFESGFSASLQDKLEDARTLASKLREQDC